MVCDVFARIFRVTPCFSSIFGYPNVNVACKRVKEYLERNNRINDVRTSQNICSMLRISIILCYNKHMRTVRQKISIS